MSNLSPSIQFDFTSTYVTESNGNEQIKVEDISGNGYDGTVHSGCSIVTDPIMGNCMSFDGTSGFLSLPILPGNVITELSEALTITCWVKVDSYANTQSLLGFGPENGTINAFLGLGSLDASPVVSYLLTGVVKPGYILLSPTPDSCPELIENQWVHLAVSIKNDKRIRLYVNGKLVFETAKSQGHTPSAATLSPPGLIGKTNAATWTQTSLFKGEMAWLSVYNSALRIDDIQADMIAGETSRIATFSKSLPLDFQLYSKGSKDDAPVLYIEQAGDGKDLDLVITNNTSSPIDIPVVSGGIASESNYHFQLLFRLGTLSKNLFGPAQTMDDWSVAINIASNSNEAYISFLCTTAVDPIAKNNGQLLFTIPKVNADPSGGARNTNVSFLYDLSNSLKGQRLQSLSIVNHTGQKYIPLHVDVVGAPQVLNDGSTENDLLFRIENIGIDPILLSHKANSTTAKSFFEVGVMVQPLDELMEWALVKQEDVSSLALDWPVIGVVASSTQSGSTSILTLEEPLAASIASGNQIVVKPPSGAIVIYTLTNKANAGQLEITVTSSTAIASGAMVSFSSDLGTLQASTGTTLTLTQNTTLPLTNSSGVQLTIAPPADVIAKAKGLSASTLSLVGKHSLPAGRKVYLVNPVGKTSENIEKATQVSLMAPHNGSISSGSSINIVTPIGGEHSAEAASLSGDGATLTVKAPLTIPQDSDLSQLQLLGTVQTATTNSKTVTLANAVSGITVSAGALIIIKPASDAVSTVTSSGAITEGNNTVTITSTETVQEGSILSLDSATPPWQVIENSLVTSAISGLQQWTITNEQVKEIVSGGSIEFMLRDIVCNLPAGQSLVTIRYYNIPGYWDGKFVVPINKGPLVTNKQLVGIGTNAPEYTLEIYDKGDTGPSLGITGETNQITLEVNEDGAPEISLKGEGSTINIGNDKNKIYRDANGKLGLKGDDELSIESNGLLIESSGSGAAKINTPVMIGSDSEPLDGLVLQIIATGAPRNDSSYINSGIAIASSMGGSALNLGVHGAPVRANCYAWIQSTFANSSWSYNPLALNPNGGNVGIGIPSPSTKLDVNGTITGTGLSISGPTLIGQDNTKTIPGYTGSPGGLAISWNNSVNDRGEVDLYNTNSAPGGDAFHFYQMTAANQASLLVSISQNGNLGIGTSVPDYPIDVVGGTFKSYQGSNSVSPATQYLDGDSSQSGASVFVDVDVNIGGAYLGNSYVAHSDKRLKDIQAKANSKNDLETVLQLSITNYSYKNKARLGNRENKGLIAQELEKVFPHAVSQHTGFTPDIYASAHKIRQDKRKNELTIHLDKKHGLKKGDIVRLITDSDQHLEKKVMAVPGSKKLIIKGWKEKTKKLFVYGKKVNDLRGIDYHQVAMLGISATQQLHKELKATKENNMKLRKESKQLKKQFETETAALRKELKSIKDLISTQL